MYKVLVPLDGSKRAEQILPYVVSLASFQKAEILLPHVAIDPFYDLVLTGQQLAQATHEEFASLCPPAQCYLAQLAADLTTMGVDVRTQVCEGITANAILDCAEQFQPDLIALSAHGRGGLDETPIGPIAEEIIHRARVPVLLVPTVEPANVEMPVPPQLLPWNTNRQDQLSRIRS